MTKASASTPFAGPFAADSSVTGLAEQAARQFRSVCCYCPVLHDLDGLGPILPGELVSHGACDIGIARFMAQVDERYGVQA